MTVNKSRGLLLVRLVLLMMLYARVRLSEVPSWFGMTLIAEVWLSSASLYTHTPVGYLHLVL